MPPVEVDHLRSKMDALDLTGTAVIPFKGCPVMEKAFFPGGNGLFSGSRASISREGTIILGSNFGCLADFMHEESGSLVRFDETQTSNTWKGLYRMLVPQTKISLDRCFFTNAWPFLHQGNSNQTNGLISAWLADDSLMKKCLGLFEETVSIFQPKLVVALGPGVSAFLSHVWPKELAGWRGNSIASMDDEPLLELNCSHRRLVCTAITHPSHSNSWRRQEPYQGTHGEIRLLMEAASRAGLKGDL
jgi:hypothetical protein